MVKRKSLKAPVVRGHSLFPKSLWGCVPGPEVCTWEQAPSSHQARNRPLSLMREAARTGSTSIDEKIHGAHRVCKESLRQGKVLEACHTLSEAKGDVGSHLGNVMRIQGRLSSEYTHLGKDKHEASLSQEAWKIRDRLLGRRGARLK